jgi:hypothetical protein
MARDENQLARLVVHALANAILWQRWNRGATSQKQGDWLRLPQKAKISSFPMHRGKCVYPSLEHVGTAGLYQWLLLQRWKVLFANDLAYTIHGIDAIAHDVRRNVFLVCEAKGTELPFKSPGAYLLRTAKGRQLSWQWCWSSLVDFADSAPTARAFLELFKPMIFQDNVERLLSVTRAKRVKNGFVIRETRIWHEPELQQVEPLRIRKNWTKERRWLESTPVEHDPHVLAAVEQFVVELLKRAGGDP